MKKNVVITGGVLLAVGILIWHFQVDVGEIFTGKSAVQLIALHQGTLKFISAVGICLGVGGIITILIGMKSQK